MKRFAPKLKIVAEAGIMAGVALSAAAINGQFEPHNVCTVGSSPSTMFALYVSAAVIAVSLSAIYRQRKQQTTRNATVG